MKRFLYALAIIGCIFTANAQETVQENKQEVRTPERSHERRLL
jgi:hypothetical protein